MSAILGVSMGADDAAAALVVGGVIVAAIQEERLSRVNADPSLPCRAARACLAEGAIDARALDHVAYFESPFVRVERVLVSLLAGFPRGITAFPSALGRELGEGIWALDRIAEALDVDRARVGFCDHMTSHAASAFFTSPFERAAVLVVDGVGGHASTAIFRGEGARLDRVDQILFPSSLGLFHAAIAARLGVAARDEDALLALAEGGEPRLLDAFRGALGLDRDGSFRVDPAYFSSVSGVALEPTARFEALVGSAPPADVAASLARVLEEGTVALARAAKERTGLDALCLAGDVAQLANVTARVLRESGFSRVFVPPAAGDAGGALGAAILAAIERGDPRPAPMVSAALGEPAREDDAERLAAALGLACAREDDVAGAIAARLDRGEIVARAEGRFEWGPRALGHRSILALPSKRAGAIERPAVAVLDRFASSVLDGGANDMTPFRAARSLLMNDHREALAAAIDRKGAASVQTVAAESPLAPVLEALAAMGHPPVIFTAALARPREPLAASATDAISVFAARSAVSALAVGDVMITRGAS